MVFYFPEWERLIQAISNNSPVDFCGGKIRLPLHTFTKLFLQTYLLYSQNKAASVSFICVSRKHFYCKRLCNILLNTEVPESRNSVLTDKNIHRFSAMQTLNVFAIRQPIYPVVLTPQSIVVWPWGLLLPSVYHFLPGKHRSAET